LNIPAREENRNQIISRLDFDRLDPVTNTFLKPNDNAQKEYIRLNCFNDLDLDMPIYRFLKYDVFVEHSLIPGKLSMSKPKFWPDPYDALLYKCPAKMIDAPYVSMEGLLDKVFAMCWTKTPESELLWNAYGDIKSIRLKSTPRKILRYLYDFNKDGFYNSFFAARVEYLNRKQYIEEVKNRHFSTYGMGGRLHDILISSLFIKTDEHRDENEIRFVFYDADDENTESRYYFFKVDINDVVDEITLNPSLKECDTAVLAQELKVKGFLNPVKQSNLNSFPKDLILDFSYRE
jgi:hypothetical protein